MAPYSGSQRYDVPAAPCASYGATPRYDKPQDCGATAKSSPRQHRTVDFVAVVVSLFLPWMIFTAVSALLTFSIHYNAPHVSQFLCVALLAVVGLLGYAAYLSYAAHARAMRESRGAHKPARIVFLFGTSLLGWIAGVVAGHLNYAVNMSPFFDVANLNVYPTVDPSALHGQQLMDAGRILFTAGSRLDLSKSMSFRSADTYCVAPVTVGASKNMSSYDFWAVGVNCCSGGPGGFRCGEYRNPHASAGLRFTRDDQRALFRLAVQQAEAAYRIKAPHPIFLYWLQDPVAEINSYQDAGYRYFLLGIFAFFAFQMFAVAAATVLFSKMDS